MSLPKSRLKPGVRPKALIAWSSGKDAAWALHEVRRDGGYEVVGALTTLTGDFSRVSMHGVREALLRAQCAAADLALTTVPIPYPCPNEVYEARMAAALAAARAGGVSHMIFGDLFLEDIRAYREATLAATGVTPLFPLWGRPTATLARDMIAGGLQARVVCLDPRKVPRSLAGRRFDETLLRALPSGTDPCAERGEFHTCVVAGPMFRHRLRVRVGETVDRDGFVFTDLLLKQQTGA